MTTLNSKMVIALAGHIVSAYRRHCDFHRRVTRDLRLIGELRERLAELHKPLSLVPRVQNGAESANWAGFIKRQTTLMEREAGLINATRRVGGAAERAAGLFQRVAEQLFLYRTHFAGSVRLSQRPGLLQRIIFNLDDVRIEMDHPIFEGYAREHNMQFDQAFILDEVASLRCELASIEREHKVAPLPARIASLTVAADQVALEYRKYFRRSGTRRGDGDRLRRLCDRLAEVEHQLVELAQGQVTNTLLAQLNAVQSALDSYEQHYLGLGRAVNEQT